MADVLGGLADREHLGVGAGVLEELALVVAGADDGPVRAEDDRPDRHVAVREGLLGLLDCEPHSALVLISAQN